MTVSKKKQSQWQAVSRIVFPVIDQDLTMPLYAIEWTRPYLREDLLDHQARFRAIDYEHMTSAELRMLLGSTMPERLTASYSDLFSVESRDCIRIHPSKHISLCTFFNAFPASYWKRWTNVDTIRFEATVRGHGSLILQKTSGRGITTPITTIEVTDDAEHVVHVNIPMDGLIDGGFFWVDAQAGTAGALRVSQAQWLAPVHQRNTQDESTFSVAITTFNRAPYCMNQLKAIAANSEVRKRLDTIYCTDQGTDLVKNQPDFRNISADLGAQLTYLQQSNLGGSGGFSRGMFETLQAGTSSYVMLLDDDAISEPEAILRAVQFADYCVKPTIVGGGMLHLDNRTVLYTQGEYIDKRSYWMKPSGDLPYNHDFAQFPLRDSPQLHRRIDAEFNGWWMCLIPIAVIKAIGLSLPIFIKFDDIEYSLRAKEHGFATVCLPGVAVWHQAWHSKDPGRTWEEYFIQRNRWITALLHETKPNPKFCYEMIYGDLLLGMQFVYSALELRHLGLRDIMRGPQYIIDSMPTKLKEVNELRKTFADTQAKPSLSDYPEPRHDFTLASKAQCRTSMRLEGAKNALASIVAHNDGVHDTQPDIAISAQDAFWRSYAHINSALVTTPDGNNIVWARRNNALYRKQLRKGAKLAQELFKRWNKLSEEYRSYNMASIEVWRTIFENERS